MIIISDTFHQHNSSDFAVHAGIFDNFLLRIKPGSSFIIYTYHYHLYVLQAKYFPITYDE